MEDMVLIASGELFEMLLGFEEEFLRMEESDRVTGSDPWCEMIQFIPVLRQNLYKMTRTNRDLMDVTITPASHPYGSFLRKSLDLVDGKGCHAPKLEDRLNADDGVCVCICEDDSCGCCLGTECNCGENGRQTVQVQLSELSEHIKRLRRNA